MTSLPKCGFIAQWESIAPVSRRSRVRIPLKPWFFIQASSFQLLKLENLLRWSLFTFIYNRSTNMDYFIYISRTFLSYYFLAWNNFQGISLSFATTSGRAVDRLLNGSRVNSHVQFIFGNLVEALIFFRLLLSNCLNWKINCDDHSSLSNTCICFVANITITLIEC